MAMIVSAGLAAPRRGNAPGPATCTPGRSTTSRSDVDWYWTVIADRVRARLVLEPAVGDLVLGEGAGGGSDRFERLGVVGPDRVVGRRRGPRRRTPDDVDDGRRRVARPIGGPSDARGVDERAVCLGHARADVRTHAAVGRHLDLELAERALLLDDRVQLDDPVTASERRTLDEEQVCADLAELDEAAPEHLVTERRERWPWREAHDRADAEVVGHGVVMSRPSDAARSCTLPMADEASTQVSKPCSRSVPARRSISTAQPPGSGTTVRTLARVSRMRPAVASSRVPDGPGCTPRNGRRRRGAPPVGRAGAPTLRLRIPSPRHQLREVGAQAVEYGRVQPTVAGEPGGPMRIPARESRRLEAQQHAVVAERPAAEPLGHSTADGPAVARPGPDLLVTGVRRRVPVHVSRPGLRPRFEHLHCAAALSRRHRDLEAGQTAAHDGDPLRREVPRRSR